MIAAAELQSGTSHLQKTEQCKAMGQGARGAARGGAREGTAAMGGRRTFLSLSSAKPARYNANLTVCCSGRDGHSVEGHAARHTQMAAGVPATAPYPAGT